MASVADYIAAQRAQQNADAEKLIKNVKQYSKNKDVLAALGAPNTQKKSKPGLLSEAINVIGIPGRLLEGAVFEALGVKTPGLESAKGLDEVRKLITGEIKSGAGDVAGLKFKKGEGFLNRAAKAATAFAIDTALDPISYVGAPGAISRKVGAEQVFNAVADVEKSGIFNKIIEKSGRGEGLIDDILGGTAAGKVQDIQKGAASLAENAPELWTPAARKTAAAEQLASDLSTTYLTRGKNEFLKKLEDLSGSRADALELFKMLPEEARGGIVVSSIFGTPVKKKGTGEFIRLFGTAEKPLNFGKLGTLGQDIRQVLSVYPGNIVTSQFSGGAGNILANVKKAELAKRFGDQIFKTPVAKKADRFVDYTKVRKLMGDEVVTRAAIRSIGLSPAVSHDAYRKSLTAEAQAEYDNIYREYFGAPQKAFDPTTASDLQVKAHTDAMEAHAATVSMFREMQAAGAAVNEAGDPERFAPIIKNKLAREQDVRLGRASSAKPYDIKRSRRGGTAVVFDEDVKKSLGYEVPGTDGNVVFFNPKSYNDYLEKAAIAEGMSPEAARSPLVRWAEEDPIEILKEYSRVASKTVSTKKFMDGLLASGTLISAPPDIIKSFDMLERDKFIASMYGLGPKVLKKVTEERDLLRKQIAEMINPEELGALRKRVAAERARVNDAYEVSRMEVDRLTAELADATAAVAEEAPNVAALKRKLKGYASSMQENDVALTARQRAVKNATARLKTAQKNIAETRDTEQLIRSLMRETLVPDEQAFYASLLPEYYAGMLPEATQNTSRAIGKAQNEASIIQELTPEIKDLRAARTAATTEGAQDIANRIYSYEQKVTARNNIIEQLRAARSTRDVAYQAKSRVMKSIGLEEIDTLDSFIRDYATSRAAALAYKKSNPTKGLSEEAAAAIKAKSKQLFEIAQEKKKILTGALNVGRSEFSTVARDYAETLFNLSEKLSDSVFQSMMIFTNSAKLENHIVHIMDNAADRTVVMAALEDMIGAFMNVRSSVPESVLKKLDDTTQLLIQNSNQTKLRNELFVEKPVTGKAGYLLEEMGFATIGRPGYTKDLFGSKGVLDVMNRLYKAVEDPTDFERFISNVIEPMMLSWKGATTLGRGPGYILNNLIGAIFNNYIGNVSIADQVMAAKAINSSSKTLKMLEKTYPEKSYYDLVQMADKQLVNELNKIKVNDKGLGDLFAELNKRGGFETTQVAAGVRMLEDSTAVSSKKQFSRASAMQPAYSQEAASIPEQLFRKGVDFSLTNRLQRAMNDINQNIEMSVRLASFVSGYRATGSLDSAMSKMYSLHFDYQDITQTERFMKIFVPFYTWTRNNVPLQIRALVMQPGKFTRALRAQEAFKGMFSVEGEDSWMNEVLPEYMSLGGGFVSKFGAGAGALGLTPQLPYSDIEKYFQTSLMPVRVNQALTSLGPFKLPFEMAAGVDLAEGRAFDKRGEEVPGYLNPFGLNPLVTEYKDGSNRAPVWFSRGIRELLPQLTQVERVSAAADLGASKLGADLPNWFNTTSQEDRQVSTTLNLLGIPSLVGMSSSTITPKTLTGELSRRQDLQAADIAVRAGAANIDLEWLRAQLKAGASPEQVALLLKAGKGQIKEPTRPEMVTRTQEERKALRQMLANL